MARTRTPAPHAARSAADAATTLAPAPVVVPAAGGRPAAAVLAALSAEPAGVAVAVIAGRAGISTAAARQALLAHEKSRQAGPARAREERRRHPHQGHPAWHPRHLDGEHQRRAARCRAFGQRGGRPPARPRRRHRRGQGNRCRPLGGAGPGRHRRGSPECRWP